MAKWGEMCALLALSPPSQPIGMGNEQKICPHLSCDNANNNQSGPLSRKFSTSVDCSNLILQQVSRVMRNQRLPPTIICQLRRWQKVVWFRHISKPSFSRGNAE